MAYKKRNPSGYKGKKLWSHYGKKAGGLAYKAWQMAKYVKSLVNVERKFCDTVVSNPFLTTGTLDANSAISEGTDYNQRDGLSVKGTSLYIRGTVNLSGTGPIVDTNARVIFFQDSDNTGSPPTASDLLESVTVNSPINHTNGKRFKILSDKVYSLSPNGSTARHYKIFIPKIGHIRWSNSTTGTREGHLYCLWLADTNTSPVSLTTHNYFARLRYIDN